MILPPCRSAQLTLRGRRSVNQDAATAVSFRDGRQLIAVADGMGGHQGGEVASAIAIQVLTDELRRGARLREAMVAANAEVFREASGNASVAGMGTTLVALVREGLAYEIANVGDSRAYRVEGSGILQITRDHSFAVEAIDQKLMSSAEVATSPWRNALTRSLGTEATVTVDLFGPFEISGPPHLVVLCSDGLYRAVSDEAFWQTLTAADDAEAATEALSELALQNQSDDNITVALLECGDWFLEQSKLRLAGGGRMQARRAGGTGVDIAPYGPPQSVEARRPRAGPHPGLLSTAAHRGRRSRDRRGLMVRAGDTILFGLSVAILLFWMAWHLLA